jgi:hypothetical protein
LGHCGFDEQAADSETNLTLGADRWSLPVNDVFSAKTFVLQKVVKEQEEKTSNRAIESFSCTSLQTLECTKEEPWEYQLSFTSAVLKFGDEALIGQEVLCWDMSDSMFS